MSNIIDAWVITGQSNPDGRQASPVNPLAEADGTLVGVQMLNPTANAFQNYKVGTNTGSFVPTNTGWDPFSLAVKQYRDWSGEENVYIIKATKGGVSLYPTATTLGSWYPDTTQIPFGYGNRMFDMFRSRIRQARSIFGRQGKVLKIRGILDHQGEGDFQTTPAAAWKDNKILLNREMRRECRNATLPIITATIPHVSLYYNSVIESAQNDIAEDDANFHLYDMSDGTLFDTAHVDYATKLTWADWTFNVMKTV